MEPEFKMARRKGPTRWNAANVKTFVPGIPPTLPLVLEPSLLDAMACE